MGQYLLIGVAHKLKVYRKGSYGVINNNDKILAEVKKEFNLDLYEMNETDDAIEFTLKPNILTTHIYDFFMEQRALFDDEEMEDELLEVLKSRDYERIMNEAEDISSEQFQELNNYLETDQNIKIFYEAFTYFSAGKIYLEVVDGLFTYLKNLICKSSDNPLKGTIVMEIE